MSRGLLALRSLIVGLALALSQAGCDAPLQRGHGEPFVDGAVTPTDRGAFLAELTHLEGSPGFGQNEFEFRLSVPNRNDGGATTFGVPSAHIRVFYWNEHEEFSPVSAGLVTEQAAGIYEVSDVWFDAAGDWQVEFDVAVGDTVTDEISYAFEL